MEIDILAKVLMRISGLLGIVKYIAVSVLYPMMGWEGSGLMTYYGCWLEADGPQLGIMEITQGRCALL